jgi:hypothetical protein
VPPIAPAETTAEAEVPVPPPTAAAEEAGVADAMDVTPAESTSQVEVPPIASAETKVEAEADPLAEAEALVAEVDRYAWGGAEVQPVLALAARLRKALTWAREVAAATAGQGAGRGEKPSLARVRQLVAEAEACAASGVVLTTMPFSSPGSVGMNLLASHYLAQQLAAAEDMQARLERVVTTQPPPALKALSGLLLEAGRLCVDVPGKEAVRGLLKAASRWAERARVLVPQVRGGAGVI